MTDWEKVREIKAKVSSLVKEAEELSSKKYLELMSLGQTAKYFLICEEINKKDGEIIHYRLHYLNEKGIKVYRCPSCNGDAVKGRGPTVRCIKCERLFDNIGQLDSGSGLKEVEGWKYKNLIGVTK